jgi:hypothetical protein
MSGRRTVLVIVADDLGASDLGASGGKLETPVSPGEGRAPPAIAWCGALTIARGGRTADWREEQRRREPAGHRSET